MKSEEDIKRILDHHRSELAIKMRDLGSDLLRIADNLEKHPDQVALSALGEIQHRGTVVDIYCGKIALLLDIIKDRG